MVLFQICVTVEVLFNKVNLIVYLYIKSRIYYLHQIESSSTMKEWFNKLNSKNIVSYFKVLKNSSVISIESKNHKIPNVFMTIYALRKELFTLHQRYFFVANGKCFKNPKLIKMHRISSCGVPKPKIYSAFTTFIAQGTSQKRDQKDYKNQRIRTSASR